VKRSVIVLGLGLVSLGVLSAALYQLPRILESRLSFSLRDAVSGSWVWNATVTLGTREMRLFYQSDRDDPRFIFTGLKPGNVSLEVRAPNYEPLILPLHLNPGHNVLKKPLLLKGLEIAGLAGFTMVEKGEGADLDVELRPLGANGSSIPFHPCLDLWVGVLVCEELADGSPALRSVASGASRGRPLFSGNLPWRWDSAIESGFRYRGTIRGSSLAESAARLLVIDYLVLVPDPVRSTKAELERLMDASPGFGNPRALLDYLEAKSAAGAFKFFTATSWNVARRSP
jgi:hypothetical protein